MQELDNINIRSAIQSGTDILGIVLTSRHITKFAVEVLSIPIKTRFSTLPVEQEVF